MTRDDTFIHLIKKHFNFLEKEYSYLAHEVTSEMVEFRSPKMLITIGKDRNRIFVLLCPIGEPKIAQLSILRVLEALSIIKLQDFPGDVPPSEYDHVLENYAKWMKLHCDSVLRGDLTKWIDILRLVLANVVKQNASLLGKQLPKDIYQELETYIKSRTST